MHLYRGTGATLAAEIASGDLSDILSRCFTERLGFTCITGGPSRAFEHLTTATTMYREMA